MSEILRAIFDSSDQNKKKSSYKYGFKNAFPPSYSFLKLVEKIANGALKDFFTERLLNFVPRNNN